MVKGILLNILLKIVLGALLVLVLYGVITNLAIILVLFVCWRFSVLVTEAFRQPVSHEQWHARRVALARILEKLTPEQRTRRAAALKLDPRLSASELAQAQIERAIQAYLPPRTKRELCAEALGAVAFAFLIPLDVALYTHDFFSLRVNEGWAAAVVAAFSIFLYAWPHRAWRSPEVSSVRIWWWTLPFMLGLLLLNHAIATRHPYLNPFNPDHDRLAAEKILSLKNNIIAGRHADWVLRYARQLDQQGDKEQAINFYRAALRLDTHNRAAADRLAQLEAEVGMTVENPGASPAATAPYWTTGHPIVKQPRRSIDLQLENVESCTVIVVPVGDVPAIVLDAVGYVIHNELNLPVYVSPDTVPLPPHTRVRGLIGGSQWDEAVIVKAFTNAVTAFPHAPVKYVLVTPADLYWGDVNYVYSTTYLWGAAVSSARFGDATTDQLLVCHRVAKESLSALLKSFNIQQSTDRNCVTSYAHNLQEFDAKGNRPNVETMKLFERAVTNLNRAWQIHKTRPQG